MCLGAHSYNPAQPISYPLLPLLSTAKRSAALLHERSPQGGRDLL